MSDARLSTSNDPPVKPAGRWDYPVREYIGAMAAELAEMARADGAAALGDLLDAAARQAGRTA